jgi:hypothetical protein
MEEALILLIRNDGGGRETETLTTKGKTGGVQLLMLISMLMLSQILVLMLILTLLMLVVEMCGRKRRETTFLL